MSKPVREAISQALNFVHGQNAHPLFKFVEEDLNAIGIKFKFIQVSNVNLSLLAMIKFDNIIKE